MATKVIMPQLGESVVEGTVTRWLKREGEAVEEMEGLLDVSTDKVETEIPSPAGGVLLKVLVGEGSTVKAGTILAWIGEVGETLPGEEPLAIPQAVEDGRSPEETPDASPANAPGSGLGFISPVVARLARERRVDLSQVKGSGEGGRITKKDVLVYLEKREKGAPEPAAWETPGEGDLFRPTEMIFGEKASAATQPVRPAPQGGRLMAHTAMRKAIAEHMAQSKRTAPHVTTVMEADMQRVSAHLEANKQRFAQDGINLTYTAYFAFAAVQALKAFPLVNSSWSEEGILLHGQINLGIAVSLGEEGLIVPVIQDADGLSLLGIARSVNDLAQRARNKTLQPTEVRGGTFTITNHGISGSLFATPVIHQPQCAILGVGAIKKRAVVINDGITIRPMVYLSLTFDHRILDGASADGFLAKIVQVLENWSG
ncbi:MAG: 2-oxo acid dehydrogenase subunit E2 [Anaerolineae bacterium]|nr:2-oxo acid dehydrogenase subunit E2 [Anaerolineae bacterium]